MHVVCQRSNKEHWEFFPELREQIRQADGRLHVARETLDARDRRAAARHRALRLRHARPRPHAPARGAGCRDRRQLPRLRPEQLPARRPRRLRRGLARRPTSCTPSAEAIWSARSGARLPARPRARVITDAVDVGAGSSRRDRRDERVGTAERPLRLLTRRPAALEEGPRATRWRRHARCVDRGIEVEYRIVGEGEHREPTAVRDRRPRARATACSCSARAGAEEVRDLLAWADVLVHPSLTEAFGVAVIEAQAMGLPVVCSDAGGLPENVEHGVTGFVVPRRDAAAMADRLARARRATRRCAGGWARGAPSGRDDARSLEHQLDRFEAALRASCWTAPASRATGAAAARGAGDAASPAAAQLRGELAASSGASRGCASSSGAARWSSACTTFVERELPARRARAGGQPRRRGASSTSPATAAGTSRRRRTARTPATTRPTAARRSRTLRRCATRAPSSSSSRRPSGWWLEHYDGSRAPPRAATTGGWRACRRALRRLRARREEGGAA